MADNVKKSDLKALRSAVADYIATFGITLKILKRRRLVINRNAFAQKYGVAVSGTQTAQIRFVEIEFIGWIDSDTEGFDDCPVMTARFNVHVFIEFLDNDDEDLSSDDVFLDVLTIFRDKFLESRDFAAGDYFAKSQPLTMPDNGQFGNDAFTDASGHYVDFNLEFELYEQPD